jgi:hypothetical protein
MEGERDTWYINSVLARMVFFFIMISKEYSRAVISGTENFKYSDDSVPTKRMQQISKFQRPVVDPCIARPN